MSRQSWNYDPALNRFAAWCILGLGVIGVLISVLDGRWWRILDFAAIIAVAIAGLRVTRPDQGTTDSRPDQRP